LSYWHTCEYAERTEQLAWSRVGRERRAVLGVPIGRLQRRPWDNGEGLARLCRLKRQLRRVCRRGVGAFEDCQAAMQHRHIRMDEANWLPFSCLFLPRTRQQPSIWYKRQARTHEAPQRPDTSVLGEHGIENEENRRGTMSRLQISVCACLSPVLWAFKLVSVGAWNGCMPVVCVVPSQTSFGGALNCSSLAAGRN